MPRPPRIEFENAWYHVMNRGGGKRIIFPTHDLKRKFISLLEIVCQEFKIEVHAYCLMDNHFHLLVKTPETNLNLAMQKLSAAYVRHHNKIVKTDGPLFRGRYKAILVAEASYLASVSRYIHRNPLEAKLVSNLRDYLWSSFQAYCGLQKSLDWLICSEMTKMVSPRGEVKDYIHFVENNRIPSMREFYNSRRLPAVLGSKAARRLVENKTGYNDTWYPKDRKSLREIALQVAQEFLVPETVVMASGGGRKNQLRAIAMHRAQIIGHYSIQEIADWMNVKTSSVTQTLTRFRKIQAV